MLENVEEIRTKKMRFGWFEKRIFFINCLYNDQQAAYCIDKNHI